MMNVKRYLLPLTVIFTLSCRSTLVENIPGKYYKRYHKRGTYDQTIILILRKDSTFSFTDQWFEINQKCKGKWSLLSKDTIILKCFDEGNSVINLITMGYMTERERRVIILARNKLKLGKSILKRVSE
jgi:hypothetical protein